MEQEQSDHSKKVSFLGEQKILGELFKARQKIENAKKCGFTGEPQSLSRKMEEVKQRLEFTKRSLSKKDPRNLQHIMDEALRQLESARKFGFREEPKMTKKAKRQAQLCKDTALKLRSQVDKLGVVKSHLLNLRQIMDAEAVTIHEMIGISHAAVQSLSGITEIDPREYSDEPDEEVEIGSPEEQEN